MQYKDGTDNNINILCPSTSFTVIKLDKHAYSNVNTNVTATTTQFVDDPDRVSPEVTCLSFSNDNDIIKYITGTTPTRTAPMCDYYTKSKNEAGNLYVGGAGNNDLECMKCAHGKVGLITKSSDANKKRWNSLAGNDTNSEVVEYISECANFQNCDQTKKTVYGV